MTLKKKSGLPPLDGPGSRGAGVQALGANVLGPKGWLIKIQHQDTASEIGIKFHSKVRTGTNAEIST